MSFEDHTYDEAKAIDALRRFFSKNNYEAVLALCKKMEIAFFPTWHENEKGELKSVVYLVPESVYHSLPDKLGILSLAYSIFEHERRSYYVHFDSLRSIAQDLMRINEIKAFL